MTQVIIHTNENGGVTVTIPSPEFLKNNTIYDVKAKDTPGHSIIVDSSVLPDEDRDFFDSWELNNGTITVNFDKAKEQTRERLRYERVPLLQAQDVLYQRSTESGADTTDIVAEKNRLRDITLLVDNCTTTSQLRAITV